MMEAFLLLVIAILAGWVYVERHRHRAGRTVGYLSRDYAIDYRETFALLAQHGARRRLPGQVDRRARREEVLDVMLNLKDPETTTSAQ